MKTLKMLAIAMFFAILGTSFIEAKRGCATGWKSKKKGGVWICVRDKKKDLCVNGMHEKNGICVKGCKKSEHKVKGSDKNGKPLKCKRNPKNPSSAKLNTPAPASPSTLSNALMNGMPVHFYDVKGGKEIASTLTGAAITGGPADTGVYTLNSNSVNIPTGATYVEVGPNTEDTDTAGTVGLEGLVATGKAYKITFSPDYELVVQLEA